MGFDKEQFNREKFNPRTKAVSVPELQQWFGDNEQPTWTVRGLDAVGMARVRAAAQSNQAIVDLAEMLASATGQDRQQALKGLMDLDGDNLPEEHLRRLELLILGSADPVCDRSLAKKIAKVYPVVFSRLTNEILTLTGLGYEPGKPQSSGEIPASATP